MQSEYCIHKWHAPLPAFKCKTTVLLYILVSYTISSLVNQELNLTKVFILTNIKNIENETTISQRSKLKKVEYS